MTINSPEEYVAGIWDWSVLDGCFDHTRIKPTDIDGHVERKGHALYMETKRPGAKVPDGQLIQARNLARTGYATTFIIWGLPGKPEKIKIINSKIETDIQDCDLPRLRKLVHQWFEHADSEPMPPRVRFGLDIHPTTPRRKKSTLDVLLPGFDNQLPLPLKPKGDE